MFDLTAALWRERGRRLGGGALIMSPTPNASHTPFHVGPTFPVATKAIGFNNLLLDLCGYWKHELQHLPHIVARIVSSLVHAHRILWGRERLNHLR